MNTPTRRIRRARLRYARSHAAARACVLTARMRSKDIALRAVARAGDDAMLAADALRMERDAAHEECARLTLGIERMRDRRIVAAVMAPPLSMADAPRPFALYRHRDVSGVSGHGTVAYGVEFPDGTVALRWVGGNPTSVVFHDRGIESVEAIHGHGGATDIVWLAESLEEAAEYEERQMAVAARLVQVICEDADRIATLTAERDHARAIAVALEQEVAVRYSGNRVPMDSDRTPEATR